MSDEIVSVPMQNPEVGLDVDSDTAHYIGILEGTIATLVIDQCKFRSLLELLTGESWEDTRIDMRGEVLQQLAIDALVKQTSMNRQTATILVAKRWQARNLPEETIVPKAVPIETLVPENEKMVQPSQNSTDMSQRLTAWKARQKSDADEIASPATDLAQPKESKPVVPLDISVDARTE